METISSLAPSSKELLFDLYLQYKDKNQWLNIYNKIKIETVEDFIKNEPLNFVSYDASIHENLYREESYKGLIVAFTRYTYDNWGNGLIILTDKGEVILEPQGHILHGIVTVDKTVSMDEISYFDQIMETIYNSGQIHDLINK